MSQAGLRFLDPATNPQVELAGVNYAVQLGPIVPAATTAVGSARGYKTGATTLVAADSGAICNFNTAAGYTFTLPAAAKGLHFRFMVQTTCTSSVHRVACATGDFFVGTLLQATDGTYTIAARDADGSTHLAWEGNGSTTSGIKGDWFDVLAISDTQWLVTAGYTSATGTEATFWKTS